MDPNILGVLAVFAPLSIGLIAAVFMLTVRIQNRLETMSDRIAQQSADLTAAINALGAKL